MPDIPQIGDLSLPQDLRFLRIEWKVQRIAWLAMVLIIIAALAGLFGKGPLSSAEQSSADGRVQVQYERFLHYRDPATLQLQLSQELVDDDQLRVSLNVDYLDGVEITRITPRPREEQVGAGNHTFVFAADQLDGLASITFHLDPDTIGSLSCQLQTAGAPPVTFHQFVYP